MARRPKLEQGFTLIELMVVVAIVAILAAVALVSYRHFTEKAKAVEAEVALAEVHRLELVYYANHGAYTDDLNTMGFSLAHTLKYYTVQVQVQSGGAAFRAIALPRIRTQDQMGLLLSRTPDGQVGVTKADPSTLAAQMGGASGGSGSSGSASKPGCAGGGDATLAQDGLLDMNFCLK